MASNQFFEHLLENPIFDSFLMSGNSGEPPGSSGDSGDRFYIDNKKIDFFDLIEKNTYKNQYLAYEPTRASDF